MAGLVETLGMIGGALGEFILNTGKHNNSIVIYKDQISNWQPKNFQELSTTHFSELAKQQPQLIIFGTGIKQTFPNNDLLSPLHKARIGIEIMSTHAACNTYNLLVNEGRDVMVALLPSS
jgi:uncharacterized protein